MTDTTTTIHPPHTVDMPIDRVLPRFKGYKEKHSGMPGWTACCPAHNDKNPSLTIWEDTIDRHVGILCFAGCPREAIVEALVH